MKHYFAYAWVMVMATVFSSCMEKVPYEQDQFVKVLGLEGSSLAEKVIELDNGDLMILGRMGRAAHEIESSGVGTDINEVEDQAPFIAITDHNGNLKRLQLYPIEDFAGKFIDVFNLENKITFRHILPLNDGGYLVLARMSGFDFTTQFPGQPSATDYSVSGDSNIAPIMIRLDADLHLVSFHSLNADVSWDARYFRLVAKMRLLPNGNIGLLLGRKVDFSVEPSQPIGYSFLELSHDLDTVRFAEDFDHRPNKWAYDFDIDTNDDLVILGTQDFSFRLFKLPLGDLSGENEQSRFIRDDGVFESENTDEQYVRVLNDGNYFLVMTDPPRQVIAEVRNSSLDLVSGPVEIGMGDAFNDNDLIRAPRAVYKMSNGDLLIYIINIPSQDKPVEGYLHRVRPDGTEVFQLQIDGTPGDVIETSDGNLVVVANVIYNGLLQRVHILKLNANGELY